MWSIWTNCLPGTAFSVLFFYCLSLVSVKNCSIWVCTQTETADRSMFYSLCCATGNLKPVGQWHFYFFSNDGREKKMNYKMIKKHFPTAAPWNTILCNINAIINHTFCLFHVLGSVFSMLSGTGIFFYCSNESLWICSSQLIWLFVLLS